MKKTAYWILPVLFLGFPWACDRLAPGLPLPSIAPLPLASPTRTFTPTATSTRTPLNTPTPALTTTCSLVPVVQWGSYGAGNLQFDAAADVAVDAAGQVYVLETGNTLGDPRVHLFDPSGAYLSQWGGAATFITPIRMVLNRGLSRIYVLDNTASAPQTGIIRVFDLDGTNRPGWNVPMGCLAMALDGQNRVYVGAQDKVIRYDLNGFSPAYFYSQGVLGRAFGGVSGLAVDGSGDLFVAAGSKVQKFDASGNYLLEWGGPGTSAGTFAGITALACDSSGNVFALDNPSIGGTYFGRVQKFDTNGNIICYSLISGVYLQAVTFAPNGEMVLVDGTGEQVRVYIP